MCASCCLIWERLSKPWLTRHIHSLPPVFQHLPECVQNLALPVLFKQPTFRSRLWMQVCACMSACTHIYTHTQSAHFSKYKVKFQWKRETIRMLVISLLERQGISSHSFAFILNSLLALSHTHCSFCYSSVSVSHSLLSVSSPRYLNMYIRKEPVLFPLYARLADQRIFTQLAPPFA